MDKIIIEGNTPLQGKVEISGAKNAVLPVMAATILTSGGNSISGIPQVRDVTTMANLLKELGMNIGSFEGDHIELAIVDDGGGMDPDKLRAIAVKRGLMDEDAASRLSNKECFNLIFAPGFSSKEQISDISGRGVGMDVVKTAINTLNGSIDIDSEMGQGTKITIKVPLTLAILPTLMVGVSGHPFALPLASVNEIFHLDLSRTNVVDGQLTIIVRDKSIPLFYLQNWLAPKAGDVELRKGHGHVVIVQLGSQRVGFVVDTLIGQEEVVIKPLDKLLQGTPGMAGATITSDGHIALILDVPDLLKQYAAASRI